MNEVLVCEFISARARVLMHWWEKHIHVYMIYTRLVLDTDDDDVKALHTDTDKSVSVIFVRSVTMASIRTFAKTLP